MIYQCVPNLSEGRGADKLRRIAEALSAVDGAELIDYSADADHNRSVFTLIGDEDGLISAVMRLFEQAEKLIDMRKHKGVHPRIGAVDVVPFAPLFGAPMQSAAELCRRAAVKVNERFKVPVYFYGKNAADEKRSRLAYLRKGGWEALQGRDLTDDER
ncbi:glutamate formiminotransferase, partial [bacterium]|nr:glutamate formiminotransferase [bacterium]